MSFGLTNAPATFNRMMDRIFREYRLSVGTFFDDIIVFSKNEADHRDHLLQVFQALRHHKLVINAKKSEFFLPEIHFQGHIVSAAGVQMDPAKIEAIRNWPDLKNVHEVRSFLGLCSYYRRYVRKFAEIASPLHLLTQKEVPFSWGVTEVTAFQTLKDKMTTGPVLILPDLQKSFEKSQERQKKAADRHRRDLKLKENDWVLLRFEKACLRKKKGKERLFPKLSMRYYGPFQITERINDVSFRLRLPDTWKIHNAFHVSLLKPFRGDVPDDGEPDEQPEVEENEEILVPEQILAHKDTKTKCKVRRRFLVKFKNYPALDAKWMEEEDLADTPQIGKLYLEAFGLA
ncbi:hypothetical protein L7F22_060894 [Adiantum nelumboides]|nr:hypothetical protein [Adiantum nelumboides]